jgi:hypothetical protein
MNINYRLLKNKIAIKTVCIDWKFRAIHLFKKIKSIQKLCIIFEGI